MKLQALIGAVCAGVLIGAAGAAAAASVYVALAEAWSEGRVRPGDLVLLATFGGGFTWGTALVRWS